MDESWEAQLSRILPVVLRWMVAPLVAVVTATSIARRNPTSVPERLRSQRGSGWSALLGMIISAPIVSALILGMRKLRLIDWNSGDFLPGFNDVFFIFVMTLPVSTFLGAWAGFVFWEQSQLGANDLKVGSLFLRFILIAACIIFTFGAFFS